jgi:hypothetical protein
MIQGRTSDSHGRREELGEIGTLFAAGLLRLLARKSSQNSPCEAKTPLDCEAPSGGHVRKRSEDLAP